MARDWTLTASESFADALTDSLGVLGWSARAARAALAAARDPDTPPGRVDIAALESMFRVGERATGDSTLALMAGHRFRVSTHGQTGSIYAYARDLGDVIALNARYQGVAIDLGTAVLAQRPRGPAMEFRLHARSAAGTAAHPQCAIMLMGAYVTAYRWLNWGSGEDLVAAGIPAPGTVALRDAAQALFGCPVDFDQSVGFLVFTERAMQTPLSTADVEKRARAVARLDRLQGAEVHRQSFQRAVSAAIRGAMGSDAVTLDTVAARMGLTRSALRRRLREHDLTFREQTDRVRRTVMAERFGKGDSLADVAMALGYNDQAAFNRAVKRWYGVPPGQWTPDTPMLRHKDGSDDG